MSEVTAHTVQTRTANIYSEGAFPLDVCSSLPRTTDRHSCEDKYLDSFIDNLAKRYIQVTSCVLAIPLILLICLFFFFNCGTTKL